MANYKFGLGKEPVGRLCVGLALGEVETGHVQLPIGRPAYVQGRVVNVDLVELQAQHRLRRQRDQHARKTKGFAALFILQTDVEQLKGREHASGVGRHGFNANRHAEQA